MVSSDATSQLLSFMVSNSRSSTSFLKTVLPLVMKDDVAEVQCQLEEERREKRLQPNSLLCLLDRCHKSVTDDPSGDKRGPDDPRQSD